MNYLDYSAAAPLLPGVGQAIDEALQVGWANPASVHAAGQQSRKLLEDARQQIAQAVGAAPAQVIATSGGTEACNLGVFGLGRRVKRVVTTAIEHPAVGAAVDALGEDGVAVVRLPVSDSGALDLDDVHLSADDLLALQWVNHETGTVLPVDPLLEAARAAHAKVFIDATQAFGKTDVSTLDVDAIAIASQKIGGPTGAGALVVKRDTDLSPRSRGGAQERGWRAGTPGLAAWVGFGYAATQIETLLNDATRQQGLRDRLEHGLVALGGVVNGAGGPRTHAISNVSFEGHIGAQLVIALDLAGVCTSSGAACSSGIPEPSPVLLAMYPEAPWRAQASVRCSLGLFSSETDIDAALSAFERILAR